MAARKRQAHVFDNIGRNVCVSASELLNVSAQVAWIGAVRTVGHHRLA